MASTLLSREKLTEFRINRSTNIKKAGNHLKLVLKFTVILVSDDSLAAVKKQLLASSFPPSLSPSLLAAWLRGSRGVRKSRLQTVP